MQQAKNGRYHMGLVYTSDFLAMFYDFETTNNWNNNLYFNVGS